MWRCRDVRRCSARRAGSKLLKSFPVAVVVLAEAAQHLPRDIVEKSLGSTLVDTNRQLESHEPLSNILIAHDEWTAENGLLTPTLKLKREQLEGRYISTVDQDFDNPIAWEEDLQANIAVDTYDD
jgi:long-chain acyl-CoA synthetase